MAYEIKYLLFLTNMYRLTVSRKWPTYGYSSYETLIGSRKWSIEWRKEMTFKFVSTAENLSKFLNQILHAIEHQLGCCNYWRIGNQTRVITLAVVTELKDCCSSASHKLRWMDNNASNRDVVTKDRQSKCIDILSIGIILYTGWAS